MDSNQKKNIIYSIVLLASVAIVWWVRNQPDTAVSNDTYLSIVGQTMGTTYNIVVVDHTRVLDEDVLEAAVTETLVDVNAAYSNWDPDSEVSRLNRNASSEPIPISKGLAEMVTLANYIHESTGGKLDLTLKPVIELWGFGPSGSVTRQPGQNELDTALRSVGQRKVIMLSQDETMLTKRSPEVSIDLSSIAKGYGIDAIVAALIEEGAEDFLVEIGGDLFVSGQTIRETDWRVGVEKPIAGVRALETAVEFSGKGMATSGDYRNYFEDAGVRYSHIIDPQTGRPITHKTASVTVIAGTAVSADAWATALLALGVDDGLELANDENLAVLFIVRTGNSDELTFNSISNTLFNQYQPSSKG